LTYTVEEINEEETSNQFKFTSENEKLILHWGLGLRNTKEWVCPPEDIIKTILSTKKFDDKAAQSIFTGGKVEFKFTNSKNKFKALNFVFHDPVMVSYISLYRINGTTIQTETIALR
jgi:hypothetical protein